MLTHAAVVEGLEADIRLRWDFKVGSYGRGSREGSRTDGQVQRVLLYSGSEAGRSRGGRKRRVRISVLQ